MLPLLGALATGAMGLFGGMMQNSAASAAADKQMDYQTASNERQMQFQREAVDRQMEFQKNSAQSSYQWGMEDMRKAGLNPILAYKQGGAGTVSGSSASGASSSGASYTPQNVGAAAVQAGTAGAASALAASRNQAELANIAADTLLKTAQDKTQTALQVQAMAQAGQANANTALTTQETINAFNTEQILRQTIAVNNPKRIIADHDSRFWSSPAAAPLLATRRLMESLNPSSIINSAQTLQRMGR